MRVALPDERMKRRAVHRLSPSYTGVKRLTGFGRPQDCSMRSRHVESSDHSLNEFHRIRARDDNAEHGAKSRDVVRLYVCERELCYLY